MLKHENQTDKKRFHSLKGREESRGRDKQKATEIAAKEVKAIRRREGRSKQGKR